MGKQLDKWYRRYGRDSKSQSRKPDDNMDAPIVAAVAGAMMSNDDDVIDPQAFVEMNAMGADVLLEDAVLLNMITDDGNPDINIDSIAATEEESFDDSGDSDASDDSDIGGFDTDGGDFGD